MNKLKTTIVKVQLPLFTTGEAEALVYDKSRRNHGFMPIDEFLLEAMGGELKKFFHAQILKDEVKVIYNMPAPWQEW
jgi:hypothetical protein